MLAYTAHMVFDLFLDAAHSITRSIMSGILVLRERFAFQPTSIFLVCSA